MAAGNLPAEVSSFVGRRRERGELKRLLAVSRLVTVTGVGGVGKTRAALRVATEVRKAFPDGVWWVELSALRDGELLAQAVAEVLGLQDQSVRPQVEVLADYVAPRRLLLVLDTCEHLVGPCAVLVDALLQAAAGLRVLATSRQPLGIAGEQVFTVPPLPVPTAGCWNDGVGLARNPAVELFVQRARAVSSDFALGGENQAAVAQLCHRLDGIPLAIELAAVRLRALSVRQVLTLLDNRFRLLTGGSRVGPPRHETLRTAIEWSHQLCTPAERLLWARTSVFTGDFDLTAVEPVCADDRLSADRVLEVVTGLVDKSILLPVDHPTGGVRYRLLDTIREYGQEWLRHSGEEPSQRRRHRDHYLRLARQCEAEWFGPDQITWSQRLNREHANLRAALDFCLDDPNEHHVGLILANALWLFWYSGGFLREGRHYLDRALALNADPGPARTMALLADAQTSVTQGDLAAADVRLADLRAHAERPGDVGTSGMLAYIAGAAAVLRGDLARAVTLCEESADLHRRGGDSGLGLVFALSTQSMALALSGDIDRAIAVTEEHRRLCERHGERWMRSFADYIRALAEMGRGDPDAAAAYARAALRFKWRLGDSLGMALTLDLLATAAVAAGKADRAARLLGIAHQVWHTFGLPQFGAPDFVAARDRCEQQARRALGDQAYQAAFHAGLNLDLDQAIDYALDERQKQQPDAPPQPTGWAPLTQREQEIAQLVTEGLTNPQIAARLVIAHRTVASHLEHILTKLGFTNRAQIAAWVSQRHPGTGPIRTVGADR
jgi:non-specific serine/threonine protein kinase